MQPLRLINVHEDGAHVVLEDDQGARYQLPITDALRAAVRRDRPRLGQLQIEIDGEIRPREVQQLIRAGVSAEAIADQTGWPLARIQRYEAPVLAEREYISNLARQTHVRGGSGQDKQLGDRVNRRLVDRDVDPASVIWDSTRNPEGSWSVTASFVAGGRERLAKWTYDPTSRTAGALNDEARWLSEGERPDGPIPGADAAPAHRDDDAELTSAMRATSGVSRRRGRRGAPADLPADDYDAHDALPLEPFGFDPQSMEPPPAARGPHPQDPPSEHDTAAKSAGRRGRTSVPSWDEIMLGPRE